MIAYTHHLLHFLSYLAIGRYVAKILPLKEKMNLTEPRAVYFMPLPAFSHEVIDLAGTCRGTR
jgi:hypothetical protein